MHNDIHSSLISTLSWNKQYHRLMTKFLAEFHLSYFKNKSELALENAEALVQYGQLALALFQQLIQLSFIIESIGTVTGKIKDAVYSVPWEYMDTKNRKYVMIFMMNVAEPVHVNALGLVKVGVTSMASILKTSFSYFAFLRSVSK